MCVYMHCFEFCFLVYLMVLEDLPAISGGFFFNPDYNSMGHLFNFLNIVPILHIFNSPNIVGLSNSKTAIFAIY